MWLLFEFYLSTDIDNIISSREMHALQRLERHRTDKSILTAAMADTAKNDRKAYCVLSKEKT